MGKNKLCSSFSNSLVSSCRYFVSSSLCSYPEHACVSSHQASLSLPFGFRFVTRKAWKSRWYLFYKSWNDHPRNHALPHTLTLADLGFKGAAREANYTESLFYDFIADSNDALLLFEPAPVQSTVVAALSRPASSTGTFSPRRSSVGGTASLLSSPTAASSSTSFLSGAYTAAALQGSGATSLSAAPAGSAGGSASASSVRSTRSSSFHAGSSSFLWEREKRPNTQLEHNSCIHVVR